MHLNKGMEFDILGMFGHQQNWKLQELLFQQHACELILLLLYIIFLIIFFFSYTPLKKTDSLPAPLPYDPIRCNGCSAVLNPYV